MLALSSLLRKLSARIMVNIGQYVEMVASKMPRRPTRKSSGEALVVPVRLAIDQWELLSDVTVTLDGERVAIDPHGFVEISLSPGIAHTFVARGNRAGISVSGTFACTVTADAANKPLLLTLV